MTPDQEGGTEKSSIFSGQALALWSCPLITSGFLGL
jgi:hypothetical protein